MDLTHIPQEAIALHFELVNAIGLLLHPEKPDLCHGAAADKNWASVLHKETRLVFSLSLTHSRIYFLSLSLFFCIPKSNYFMIVVVVVVFSAWKLFTNQ